MTGSAQSFWEHVAELRKRLLISMLALIGGTIACFGYAEPAARFIIAPIGDASLVVLSPPELFMSYVRIALLGGAVLASPVALFQAWLFVRPGLERSERRSILGALVSGAVFFLAGSAFAFAVVLPITVRFFLQFENDAIKAMFSFREYLGFVESLVLSFGIAFELPVVSLLLAALGIVKGSMLRSMRRYAILVIFIAAAILTPPDVVSQVVLALPLLALYEISVILAGVVERKRARRAPAELPG